MGQSFFIWNGIDCRSKGVIQRGPVPIVRAEERVRHVSIPGRAGDLTQLEGEDIYNSYIQTVSISVRGAFNVRNIYKWLRGSGYVTFSGEPDRRQEARIIGAITLNRVSRNMDHWAGEVQFYCSPFKELLREPKITLDTTGATVRNNGDVIALPLWAVTVAGSGGNKSISLTAAGDGTPEENTIAVTGLTGGTAIWIDSQTMEVLNADGSATLTQNSVGEFPVLGVGNNTISFTGCSEIEIERRERYL